MTTQAVRSGVAAIIDGWVTRHTSRHQGTRARAREPKRNGRGKPETKPSCRCDTVAWWGWCFIRAHVSRSKPGKKGGKLCIAERKGRSISASQDRREEKENQKAKDTLAALKRGRSKEVWAELGTASNELR